MNNRNGIIGLIVAIIAALFGGRAIQQRRNAGNNGGLIGGIGGQEPGAGGNLGGLLGGLGGEQPSTGGLRTTDGKPVQEV